MIVKKIFDICITIPSLIILSPVLLIIMIWIKLDSPGPVFFRQERVGRFGRNFRIYKFRTMVSTAELLGKQITVENDFRVTRCGRFLRKYKLDELPQLFNIIKGDMSIIGPRPDIPYVSEMYQPHHKKRLRVRPGVTGLWQISGRRRVTFEEMVRLDNEYIDKQSPLLDTKIIFLTALSVINRDDHSV